LLFKNQIASFDTYHQCWIFLNNQIPTISDTNATIWNFHCFAMIFGWFCWTWLADTTILYPSCRIWLSWAQCLRIISYACALKMYNGKHLKYISGSNTLLNEICNKIHWENLALQYNLLLLLIDFSIWWRGVFYCMLKELQNWKQWQGKYTLSKSIFLIATWLYEKASCCPAGIGANLASLWWVW